MCRLVSATLPGMLGTGLEVELAGGKLLHRDPGLNHWVLSECLPKGTCRPRGRGKRAVAKWLPEAGTGMARHESHHLAAFAGMLQASDWKHSSRDLNSPSVAMPHQPLTLFFSVFK